jgi:hypothetical protein
MVDLNWINFLIAFSMVVLVCPLVTVVLSKVTRLGQGLAILIGLLIAQATSLFGTYSWFRHVDALAAVEGRQNIGIPIIFIAIGIALALAAVPIGVAIALKVTKGK